jgi:geranylgeranyl diphosphate synthase type II
MDHAQTRRGNTTVHTKWDEATAILCGDYLVALSFDLLTQLQTPHLPAVLQTYHRMIRLLCEGQMLDKEFETRRQVSVDDYMSMIDRKTGALIQAVFEIGGLLGGAAPSVVHKLTELGLHVGRAFQIQDDLLDLTAENKKWGKKVGGDLIEGKKAYLLLRALESNDKSVRSFFEEVVATQGLAPDRIPAARVLLENGGVLQDAREAVRYHSSAAQACLDALPGSREADALRALILSLQARIH